jgi:hypothetical protein
MGPLNADRLRRAKTRLEDGEYSMGGGAASLKTDPDSSAWSSKFRVAPPGPRTSRILLGKRAEGPGVVGRTFTDEWGDLESLPDGVGAPSRLLDERDDAFE